MHSELLQYSHLAGDINASAALFASCYANPTDEWMPPLTAASLEAHEDALLLCAIQADQETVLAALAQGVKSGVLKLPAATKRIVKSQQVFDELSQLNTNDQSTEALRRMLLVMVEDPRSVLLALVVQIRLLRSAIKTQADDVLARAQAARTLYAPLAGRLGVAQLKWELEDLAFRALESEAYARLAGKLEERRVDREAYISEFTERLAGTLSAGGIKGFEISGRVKHLYSIYKKMQKKQLRYEQLFDLRAVRILLNTPAECYTALGIVHGTFSPIPGQFDDYIGQPKPNGYQSLHTVVSGPEHKAVEIQMRTFDMHREAELGVAAHWQYKEGGTDQSAQKVIQRLRGLLELDGQRDGIAEDLDTEDLFSERVFALTPRGDVIDMAQGATVLDFAYSIHTSIGHRCRGAKVNGEIVPLTYALHNAQTVEVLTSKEERPSRDWLISDLGYLKTQRARTKVRHFFNQLDHDQHQREGREVVERVMRRHNLDSSHLAALVQRFRLGSEDDLMVSVGRGDINSAQLAAAMEQILKPAVEKTLTRKRSTNVAKGEVRVQGVGNLLTQLATCCKPVPFEPIVGLLTKSKGVSVHRSDCINMLHLPDQEQHRLLEVSWGEEPDRNYAASIKLQAYQRDGLLRDIGHVLANNKVRLVDIRSHYDAAQDLQLLDLEVELPGADVLSTLLHHINALPNILGASRA